MAHTIYLQISQATAAALTAVVLGRRRLVIDAAIERPIVHKQHRSRARALPSTPIEIWTEALLKKSFPIHGDFSPLTNFRESGWGFDSI